MPPTGRGEIGPAGVERQGIGPAGTAAARPGRDAGATAPARTGRAWLVPAWIGSRTLLLGTLLVTAAINGWSVGGVLGNWDVAHFARIARQGYAPDPREMAFFPGLPLLMRLGSAVGLAPEITGVLLCLVGSALAAWALARIVDGAGDAAPRGAGPATTALRDARDAAPGVSAGTWAAVAWLIAPTAVFTVVGYTEALFCAAAFWAWERARSERWAAAAGLAAVATTFRVSGLFLIGALAILALSRPADRTLPVIARLRGVVTRLAWLLVPLAVLAAYVWYLWSLTGSWTAWFAAQQAGWQRTFTLPWDSISATLTAVRPGGYADANGWGWMFRYELVSFAVGLLTTGWMLRRRRWAEAAWVGVQLLAFSFSPWLMSVNRAVLLWFPTWMIIGELVSRAAGPAAPAEASPVAGAGAPVRAGRGRVRAGQVRVGRVVVALAGAGSVLMMVWWAWMFATGQWSS